MNFVQGMLLKAKKVAFGIEEVDLSASPFVSLSDCHSCSSPCADEDHPHYPSYLKINREKPLLYSVKPYTRHVLISTGKDDWEGHIEDDKDSLAPHLSRAIAEGQRRQKESSGGEVPRIMLTNSSKKAETWDGPGWQVCVLPDQLLIDNVTPEQCDDFFEAFLKSEVGQSPFGVTDDVAETFREVRAGKTTFVVRSLLPKAVVMLCSHKRRDKRCGVTAPFLNKEFKRILRSKDILGDSDRDVEIWLVSHIGGKKRNTPSQPAECIVT